MGILKTDGKKEKTQGSLTTFSDHWMRKYPNLIVDFYPSENLSANGCIKALTMALNSNPKLRRKGGRNDRIMSFFRHKGFENKTKTIYLRSTNK